MSQSKLNFKTLRSPWVSKKADATAVLTGRFTTEFEPIKRRMESSLVLTDSDLFLDPNETCYYTTPTTWHQSRVQTRGYSGTSVSLPAGIKGVRFRFGGYTPVRTEQMTPLAAGTLLVTSKRLLFNGESRNTTISLKKIVDGHVFSDCVKIEKSTGKPDLFTMNAAQGRFVLSLVGALKEH